MRSLLHPVRIDVRVRLPLALATALPLACIGGGTQDTETTASATGTTSSSSSSSDSKTATSSKTTTVGTASGTTAATSTAASATVTSTATTATTATAAETTTADMTDSSGDPTDCTFLCSDVPKEPAYCNYWSELCPEGTKCTFDGELYKSHCVEIVRRPLQEGEACEVEEWLDDDMCDDNLLCWEGTCVPFCSFDVDDASFSCDPEYICTFCQECALGICTPGCDPLINDCPGDDLCLFADNSFICVLDASGEDGAYGDPCEYANACDPGLFCADAELVPECMAAGCCAPFCALSDPVCPDEALVCTPWFEEGEAPPKYQDVGVCVLPDP